MARDDFHVIVYQILSYLYSQLKAGNDVDQKMLRHDSPLMGKDGINERYWSYIMATMIDLRLIDGCTKVSVDNACATVAGLDRCQITPVGIEYLTDNSFMAKAKEFLKEAKAIVPFV